ncbi:hypothetical protein NZD89_13600 [Alicyclobacillus fastidiosus]|uniref:DoxX family protein n=1 Tax=Alicyclobacillus fastidiosus TaxID=392011 RepID=A0ABY6ZNB3_9BACL|nr:hypothetical protein [Alicyclobacillus fastidiosus]WAH44326.1 hypothetical protein NZD89_13600 [Alicyclobacillus fastidiosus]GMA60654.1 hypothetical protein GCM10025859_10940 [Alicyclobacillus fastidiosus]
MRTAICTVAAVFGVYVVISGFWIAEAGATNDIPQLAAAGVAELIVALASLLGAGLIFWNRWVALAMFGIATLWSACVAIIYFDETVWIWCGVALVLALSCAWVQRRRRPSDQRQGNPRLSELSPE